MSPNRADILAAISHEPNGITTLGLQAKLGGNLYSLSAVASKLLTYGKISAVPLSGRPKTYLWKPKALETA